jgi:proline dehydrogenase
MTSEISMAMIIPNERVIDLVKKSKKPNQKSSYTFDLLGEDEYISLFTTCKYLEYYKSLLNSLNQLIESKYFENEKQELIKAYSLKEALKERIDILERVCTVLKENNV